MTADDPLSQTDFELYNVYRRVFGIWESSKYPSDPSYNICKFIVHSIIMVDLKTGNLQFFKYNKKNNRKPTARDKNHVKLKNVRYVLKESVSSVQQ